MPDLAFLAMLVTPVLAQSGDAIVLPGPTGSFAVGRFTHEWRDTTRRDDFIAEREHIAGTFTVWYPAESGAPAASAPYDPLHDEFIAALEADPELAIWSSRLAPVGRLVSHAREGIAVSEESASYPVVLLSPGGNVSRRAYTALSEELASHGFIVCAVSHPYSGLDLVAGELHSSHERWDSIDGDDEASKRADDALSDHLAMDAIRALDRLIELAGKSGHSLEGRLDESRVAIVGHSRGGSTVGRACSLDARFRAAVVLDNVGPDQERDTGIEQPLLSIRTDEGGAWDGPRIEGLRGYLSRNRSAGYEVVIRGAVHMSFTDIPFAIPQAAQGALSTERVLVLTSGLVRSFLARHLDGEQGSQLEDFVDAAEEVTLFVHTDPTTADPESQVQVPEELALVRAAIEQRVERGTAPSIVVGVGRSGEVLWQEGFGWADETGEIAATPATPYPVASLTKSITATAALVLAERGRLDLDAPVVDYLGEGTLRIYTGTPDGVTLRRLLRHTAGIPHGWVIRPLTDADETSTSGPEALRYAIVAHPPGEFLYSNFGYGVAEAVIEAVSGESYGQFLKKTVFDPLGMHDGGPVATREIATRSVNSWVAAVWGGSAWPPTAIYAGPWR